MLQARRLERPSPALPALSRDPADVTAECFGLRKDAALESILSVRRTLASVLSQVIRGPAYEHIERLDHICVIMLKRGIAVRTVSQRTSILAA